jgi:hypothetical protein
MTLDKYQQQIEEFHYSCTAVSYNPCYTPDQRKDAADAGGLTVTHDGSISGNADDYKLKVVPLIPYISTSVANVDPNRVKGSNPR